MDRISSNASHTFIADARVVDPKVAADLMGQDVNVNLNVYTKTSLDKRFEAVEMLESAFCVNTVKVR